MAIRLAVTAFSRKIFAGRPNKKGDAFAGQRHDVTSDALKAIGEYVGIGNEVMVEADGQPKFKIIVVEHYQKMKRVSSNDQ